MGLVCDGVGQIFRFIFFFSCFSSLVFVSLGGAPSTVKHFRSEIRNKSGNTLETLSEQILNFQVSYGWRSQTLENKADSLPRLISELCYPQYGWYPFLFWKGPSMEQPELVMKFLTVLGAPLNWLNPKVARLSCLSMELIQKGTPPGRGQNLLRGTNIRGIPA